MTIDIKLYQTPNAPVVALHSSASSGAQWKHLVNDMAGRFDVYTPNLPGCGVECLSLDASKNGVAAIAGPVIEQIEKLNHPVHLIGHSNGAGIALKVALMRPDLIKSLTLYEPGAFHLLQNGTGEDRKMFEEIKQISETLNATSASQRPELGMKEFIDFWNCEGTWDQLPENGQQRFSKLATSVIADFARIFSETWDLEELRNLDMPTLVLMGMDSPQVAQRVSMLIANTIPGAQLALLPGLGHMAPIFAPKWVNPRILNHIANAERPAMNCLWPLQVAA